MTSLGVIWSQFGPYHFARVAALRQLCGPDVVHPIEFSNFSSDYSWERSGSAGHVVTLCPDEAAEDIPFTTVFQRVRRKLAELKVRVCLVPSYWPRQSLAALLAAKSLGIRTVMMNESHAGTARASGLTTSIKEYLVSWFDAALVGGEPHKRYFASLGFPEEKIFTGYDAVDNDYFARRAEEVRGRAAELRKQYGLPDNYFLNLGRFVRKKNLVTLLRAYRLFLDNNPVSRTHLVLVGSGEQENELRALCAEYRLPAYEKQTAGQPGVRAFSFAAQPGVHFYGFRQIDQTPVFYALADAFILPSLREEWGLVVNEAMASGLPVVVSETAGCAEDLLERGMPRDCTHAEQVALLGQGRLQQLVRENGFRFDPRSANELSQVLLWLESCPRSRRAMGLASRRIVEKFSCENFARNALLAVEAAFAPRRLKRTTRAPGESANPMPASIPAREG